MENCFEEYSKKLREEIKRNAPERRGISSNLIRPFFYLKIKRVLKKIEKRIKEIDFSYKLPIMKIRLTFKEHLGASCSIDDRKDKIILRVNARLKKRSNSLEFERSLAHELMHLWIGFDLPTGKTLNLPQNEPFIKEIKFYVGKPYKLRYKLCCFLYQQVMIGNIGKKMMHIEGYDDIWFRGGRNPFVNFEEMLVTYAVMKLFGDPIDYYPALKKAFKEDYEDKKLLLFIDKEMPNIRVAVEKLVNEF